MFGKLLAQTAVSFIIFGNDQQTASVFVNTVDDARTFYTADAGKAVPTMVKQGINQSSAMRSGRRMYSHSCRFVDNQQVIVFINNVQRNIFRLRISVNRFRYNNLKRIPYPYLLGIIGNDNIIV